MKKILILLMIIVLCFTGCSCEKTTYAYHEIVELESGCYEYFEVELQGAKPRDKVDVIVEGIISGNFYIQGKVISENSVLITITNLSNKTLSTNNFEYKIIITK